MSRTDLDDLTLEATASSPAVEARAAQGLLRIRGEAYPENAFAFFSPVLAWTEAFLAKGPAPLRVELELTYLNTSSIKSMMDLMDLLQEAFDGGRDVGLAWFYDPENDRALDLAEEFREDLTLPFDIVPRAAEGLP
ncbi:MAG TPA: biofilm regulation phosphoprotein SiaC [Holophaga sp.]|nr:biofilm regulation phosphoprotein SiaC [Holophaga sp.]